MKKLLLILLLFISIVGYSQTLKALLMGQSSTSVFTLTYSDVSPTITETGLPDFISFKPDGTKCYISDNAGNTWQYSLTAWDISTLSYESKTHNADESGTIGGATLSSDGLHLYLVNNTSDNVNQYDLSTAWDISTAATTVSYQYSFSGLQAATILINPSGANMYLVIGTSPYTTYKYPLSTSYRVSTAGTSTDNTSTNTRIVYSNDGSYFYEVDGSTDITSSVATPAYSLSLSGIETESVSTPPNNRIGLWVGDSGTKFYIADNITDKIYEYEISY